MSGGRIALIRAALGGAFVVASLGACRGIAGLRDLTYVAPPVPCAAPSLPTEGGGRVRLVNASTAGSADFCIRASGTKSWGRSVLTGGGPTCPSGLDYAQATIPFAVPGGSVDVEAVAAGASCDSAPMAQLASVAAGGADPDAGAEAGSGASPVVTVVVFGKSGTEQLVALPEEPPSPTEVYEERLRVIDALASGENIQVGIASRGSLPATVANAAVDVASGSVPAQQGPIPGIVTGIDAEGYLSTEPLTLDFGVVLPGQTSALAVVTTPENGATQTLVALGDTRDPLHRVRGLLCDDAVPTTADAGAAPSILAACQLTSLPDLTVDTVNVSLYGAAAPFWKDREPLIPGILAARTSDLLCVVEADDDADKQAIAEAYEKAQGGYAFYPTLTLATLPDDPTTADGGEPASPGIPCAGVPSDTVAEAYACMEQDCATPPDATGVIGHPACLTNNCAGTLGGMYYAGPSQQGCFDCILYYAVSGRSLSEGMTACTTSSVQPLAFDGMATSIILSRYPFAAPPQAYVLPSTGFRRVVVYAPVQLEDQVVDFYCAQLSSPLIDVELPYTGSYGSDVETLPDGGTTKANGYEEEQDLQVQQVIRFVQATSGKSMHPAILAGDWHAGLAASLTALDGGTQSVLSDLSPEVARALDQRYGGPFVRAEPPGYTPVCEFCPAPADFYNSGDSPADLTTTYLFGFAPGSTTDDSIWGTSDDAVTLTPSQYETLPPDSADGKGPLFEYWPRTVSVLRPVATP